MFHAKQKIGQYTLIRKTRQRRFRRSLAGGKTFAVGDEKSRDKASARRTGQYRNDQTGSDALGRSERASECFADYRRRHLRRSGRHRQRISRRRLARR